MKKLFKTLAVVLLASATTFASVTEEKKVTKETKTFAIGMYQMKNTSKVRLMLDKHTDNVISVKLTDELGSILHRDFINKKQTNYGKSFDLSRLNDGTYTFVIESKNEKTTREVVIETNEPTFAATRKLTLE